MEHFHRCSVLYQYPDECNFFKRSVQQQVKDLNTESRNNIRCNAWSGERDQYHGTGQGVRRQWHSSTIPQNDVVVHQS